jgi:hypothetical protein
MMSSALSARRGVSTLWHQIWHAPRAVRICLSVWILAGLFGAYQTLSAVHTQVRAQRTGEYARRLATWSPIYGFSVACAPRVVPQTRLVLVDPTGSWSPSTAYGQAPDVDTNNEAAFVYALYPRQVTPLGHVPIQWTIDIAGADYVALWEQVGYRSQSARAAARGAEKTLLKALPENEVCRYADGLGDRGAIFAISPRAIQAMRSSGVAITEPTADTAIRSLAAQTSSWMAFLRTLLGLASLWCIGAMVLYTCSRKALARRLAYALAFPMGCLAMVLELLVSSVLGIRWSVPWLLLPWLLVAGWVLWQARAVLGRRPQVRTLGTALARTWRHLALDERIALAILVSVAGLVIVAAPLGMPYSDGFQLYYFKALAFFTDGSLAPYYRHAAQLSFSIPAHPPLIPLSVVWLYLIIGRIDEHTTLLLWPALYLSLLSAFYLLARTAVSRRLALWCTAGLAVIGADLATAAVAGSFTDMPLAVYLFIGCGLLWQWATPGQHSPRILFIAGLCLGAAALTKEEGFSAALIVMAATPLLAWRRSVDTVATMRPQWWGPLVWVLPALLLVLLPWQGIRLMYPIPELLIQPTGRNLATLLGRLASAALGVSLRAIERWVAALALVVAWGVLHWRRAEKGITWDVRGSLLFLTAVVFVQGAADVVGIAVSPVEVGAEVSTTAGRLLLQLTPLVFLASVELWQVVLDAHNRAQSRTRPSVGASAVVGAKS